MTPEQRVEAFRRMVEQRPGEPFARYSLAMSLRAVGRGDEAARAYERGIAAASRANDPHARSELEQALGVLRAQGTR